MRDTGVGHVTRGNESVAISNDKYEMINATLKKQKKTKTKKETTEQNQSEWIWIVSRGVLFFHPFHTCALCHRHIKGTRLSALALKSANISRAPHDQSKQMVKNPKNCRILFCHVFTFRSKFSMSISSLVT